MNERRPANPPHAGERPTAGRAGAPAGPRTAAGRGHEHAAGARGGEHGAERTAAERAGEHAADPHFAERTGSDPQERLIVAAIAQIEKHGLAQLTVRGVAAAAAVNIAAVNYYFRSKDALVAAALEGTIRHMVEDSDDFLARMPVDPEGVLGELLAYYLEGALRYPRISRAHLHDAFVADDYSGPFAILFAPVMQRLRRAIRDAVPGLEEQQAARRVVAALSAVFFPAFFAEFYRPLGAFESAPERASYLREVARAALGPPEPPPRARSKGR